MSIWSAWLRSIQSKQRPSNANFALPRGNIASQYDSYKGIHRDHQLTLLTNSDIDGVLEVVMADTRFAVGDLGCELEFLELVDDVGDRVLLDSTIDRPAVKGPQSILVVKSSLLAAGTGSTMELVQYKVELLIEDGLDVGSSGRKWTYMSLACFGCGIYKRNALPSRMRASWLRL